MGLLNFFSPREKEKGKSPFPSGSLSPLGTPKPFEMPVIKPDPFRKNIEEEIYQRAEKEYQRVEKMAREKDDRGLTRWLKSFLKNDRGLWSIHSRKPEKLEKDAWL